MAILSRVTGRELHYFQVPMANIRQRSEDMAIMYEWFDRTGYQIDGAALRRELPEIQWHSFESWAQAQDWASLLRQ